MKKMVCEICNSRQIRKENGVFVCQECGTEYSVDDAKKLLREIEESNLIEKVEISSEEDKQNTDVSGKEKLITLLYYWAYNISKIPDTKIIFGYENINIASEEFWNMVLPEIISMKKKVIFPKLKNCSGPYKNGITELYFNNSNSYKEKYEKGEKDYIASFNDYFNDSNSKLNDDYSIFRKYQYIAKRFYDGVFLDEALENMIKKQGGYDKVQKFFNDFKSSYGEILYIFDCSNKKYEESPLVDYCDNIIRGAFYYQQVINKLCDTKIIEFRYGRIFGKKFEIDESNQKLFDDILKKSYECVKEFIKQHNELMDYYSSKYDEICLITKEIADNCKNLEKDLFLPYKYRNLSTIFTLIDLLKDGKATNWKELINLYDTQQFRAGVYERLDAINSKLDDIQETLIVGFKAVINGINRMQKQLALIDSQMDVISQDISKIKRNTFITMWSTL